MVVIAGGYGCIHLGGEGNQRGKYSVRAGYLVGYNNGAYARIGQGIVGEYQINVGVASAFLRDYHAVAVQLKRLLGYAGGGFALAVQQIAFGCAYRAHKVHLLAGIGDAVAYNGVFLMVMVGFFWQAIM